MVIRYSLLLTILLLCPLVSQAAQINAVTDRTRTSLEESFNLELRATGSVDGEPDLSVLEKDFELLGRSQSSQIQMINGDFSRTTTWSLTLLARSVGSKQIPSICVGNDCSQPVAIEVLPAGHGNSSTLGENEVLLEVNAEPDKLWVQSQLLYKVRLLTRIDFLQASLSEPQTSGVEAVVQKLGEDRNYETERNGLRYRVVERSYAIFPQQSGHLKISAVRFGAQVAEGGRRGFDPFNQRTRQLRKESKTLSVDVLPAEVSAGKSWLPASDLQLADDWQQPPQLTVGEPATRTITLRASGLPSAQLPLLTLEVPDGVRSYPDQPGREDQHNENGIIGVLQQKVALVPTRPGPLHLPEITIDWWDLGTKRWRQTLLPAIDLEVLPATGQTALAPPPPVENRPLPQVEELQPVQSQAAPESPKRGFWPWLSLLLASGWLVTLLLLIKTRFAQHRNTDSPAQQTAILSLKQAHRELQQALESRDQGQLRKALLSWGAALFPEHQPANLEVLATLCGEPLQQQLETFNRSLYSRKLEPWNGEKLMTAVLQVEREVAEIKSPDQLPPLYPH